MPYVLMSEATCPYCGTKLQELPPKRKKCPQCKKYLYVRSFVSDRQPYLVTQDELEAIDKEWNYHHGGGIAQVRTPEDWQRLFSMPLEKPIERRQEKGLLSNLFRKKALPVRWVLGPWCQRHCRRIAGHPSCHDLAGEYPEGWDSMPTVPAGDVACHSIELGEWWNEHHDETEESPSCDCWIELFIDGEWRGDI